ncbi:TIGR02678 family protein [Nocardia harenae]|uniref:TIGR02678 family protein n=1 Tax=Nocardia harenae TaxID=358707 RepID=UPI00082F26AA|nr:TIGR02678 family protein [Nocardia harenae]
MTDDTGRARSLGTRSYEAAAVREAARVLLETPIVTAARAPESLALIRRHAAALRTMFGTQLGYQLVVEPGFARLAKSPPEADAPLRNLARRSGTPLDAATYTLVALACAALLAPGVGEQILISQLVAQIRADAAEQQIALSDGLPGRRRLVAALGVLIEWGVLTETDGTVAQWGDSQDSEGLLTVCRPLLPHILIRSIGPAVGPDDVLAPETGAPRQRLRRRLTENPAVLRENLSPEELDVLSRERNELARLLNDNFGLTLEVRAEGALAYDPADALGDIAFPGPGTVKQAALLLIGELADRGDGEYFPFDLVDTVLGTLIERHRRIWKAEYGAAPDRLREDIVELLRSLCLAERHDGGLRLLPPAHRYRPRITVTTQLTLEVQGEESP